MDQPVLHTPYVSSNAVGTARPFTIGLSKLEPRDWIEVDDLLGVYLAEKDRVTAAFADRVFMAEPDSAKAQAELLKLLAEHLPARFPQIYRRVGQSIEILPLGRSVALDGPNTPPLQIAAGLVQEDLVLMRGGEAGWRLGAGSLSFPSSWRLTEKFGKVMHDIHAPVPGFGEGSRNAQLIDRMFDNLRPDHSVLRWNWGIYEDAALYHPASSEDMRRFGDEADIFIRVERQTLRKLPVSGDIVFSIRIHLNALTLLAQQPNGGELAAGLGEQIGALSDTELAYKGLLDGRDRLLALLAAIR
ncbi:DUF3445 domain-containing protein [Devosia sp.]|uniref:heme-dependent oxidative N-demethylase family protein n=1 Tax=Devosia sp. TaxID=1871048 RepID=UPI0032676EC3